MKRGRTSTPVRLPGMDLQLKTDTYGAEDEEIMMFNPTCCQCGASQTPQWREGPNGPKTLCNACGVKYYRQAKRTRKGGGGGGAPAKARRVVAAARARHAPTDAPVAPRHAHHPALSSDSYCTMSTHAAGPADRPTSSAASEESIEEHDAAMSLLSFAGVDTATTAPVPTAARSPRSARAPAVPSAALLLLANADATLLHVTSAIAAPNAARFAAALPVLVKLEEPSYAAAAGVDSGAAQQTARSPAQQPPATAAVSSSAPNNGVDSLIQMLGAATPPSLAALQAAAEGAHKDAAAADAAIAAVTRFLHEKTEEAHCARVRLALAEQMLLQRVRQIQQGASATALAQAPQQQQQEAPCTPTPVHAIML
ncbi:hypothetical protein FOA52_000017 [Chlamydomonas sp. UWO 241]|nr:hypothetical protein FOA52_000017 [Chlamydomonas sp. UWO 241]